MSKFGIVGMSITPPIIGRIAIGKMVAKGDQRLPQKDDQFTITTQTKRHKEWVLHPMHEILVDNVQGTGNGEKKLRSIPVKLMFDDVGLNIRNAYTCFNKDGRQICTGNGESAKRLAEHGGSEEVDCPGADKCEFGAEHRCKPYGRSYFQIDGQDDELGAFIFRTTGWNSTKTLTAKMHYLKGVSDGNLAGMPLTLRLLDKSSQMSKGSEFYYVDLVPRVSLAESVKETQHLHKEWEAAGMNRDAFEAAVRECYANGSFEDTPEDEEAVYEEFFSGGSKAKARVPDGAPVAGNTHSLLDEADGAVVYD